MAHSANKTLIFLSILLISCQTAKSIPDNAFADVNLYFNKDLNDCSSLVAVARKIPKMKNIEALTLGQLFAGPNEEESAYNSPFSKNTKDILRGFHIVDKKAYVELQDITNRTCAKEEIDATIKQFGTIDELIYQ